MGRDLNRKVPFKRFLELSRGRISLRHGPGGVRDPEAMLGLCLAPLVFLLFLIDWNYFRQRASPNFSVLKGEQLNFSHEVEEEAARQFRALRRNFARMVILDGCGALGLLLLGVHTLRIWTYGTEYLPADEIYHTYTYAFNLITLSLAFSPNALKLEPYVMIGRIIGSLAFLDLRHGLCINVLFSARRLHFLFGTFSISDGLMIFVQEVCVTTCVLLIPWAIEVIARQWISLMLSASDLETALQAARTVIASAADAQGELDKDLKLMQVSPKLAHLFQAKTEELEGRSFLELLAEDDHERFQNVLRSAYELAEQQGQPTPFNLNVSKRHSQKDLEIHICSMPKERRRGPQFFFAITEVREKLNDGDEGELEAEKVLAKNGTAPRDGEPPRLTAEALATHSWATPVPNCSSLWEVKVLLDEASLEVHEINLTLNTNHWKKSRKTFLKECILPGAWDDLKRWIQGSLKGRPGDPPFIVPFGFPRIMSAIACARNVELKRKVGSTGRNELSLRLKHIFVRRPVVPAPPPVGRSTSQRSHDTL
ncbi:unnamed protein product [Durusdinium trenchii]|uniref:PAS domain-containing protein n=2 Tax=Durusdinium trenchii TaxID=1381693 RepID=A0ABP0K5C4_9DINO